MKSIFYCDIKGTYDGGVDRKQALLKFVTCLDELDDSEEMVFSFISSDDVDDIRRCMLELSPYLKGSKIVFGKQYAFDRVIDGDMVYDVSIGKGSQICGDLGVSFYDRVYYAEDQSVFRLLVGKMVQKSFPNMDLTILETNDGIDSLNDALYSCINHQKHR